MHTRLLMNNSFTAFSQDFPPYPKKASRKTRRETILRVLEKNEYGLFPDQPIHLDASVTALERNILAGKGEYTKYTLTCEFEKRNLEYNFDMITPYKDIKSIFIYLYDANSFGARLLPYEKILDSSCGIAMLDINSVSADDGKLRGLAAILTKDRRTTSRSGKYTVWAWAMLRIKELIRKLFKDVKIGVIADSHLAASALLCAAKDGDIDFVCVNGMHPTALMPLRMTDCDDLYKLVDRHGGRFCPKFVKNVNNDRDIDFDTHFLASLIYPRKLLINVAENEYIYNREALIKGLMQIKNLYSEIKISCDGKDSENAHIVLGERIGEGGLCELDWEFYINETQYLQR